MPRTLELFLLIFVLAIHHFAFSQNSNSLNEELFQASKAGDAIRVKELLEQGANVNAMTRTGGGTPLIAASYAGHAEVVQILLDHGADRDLDFYGNALSYAAGAGQAETLKVLLANGAKVNSKILREAVSGDKANPAVVQMVVAMKPDLNEKDSSGFTPVMHATAQGKTEIADILLKAGADRSGCDELTLTNAARKGDWNSINDLLKKGIDINSENVGGSTALWSAVFWNQREVTKLLIDAGADVNHRSGKNGVTALMAMYGKNNVESLQLLLEHSADINVKDHEGKTALLHASEYCNVPVIKFFIDHGADVTETDKNGENALVRCLNAPYYEQKNLLSAIEILISAGVDVNQQDPFGRSPAQIAFYSRNLERVRLIAPKVHGKFWKGAEEDFRKAMDNPELVQLYLDAGADVNAGQELGWNFFMDAVRRGSPQSVQILINAGADVNTVDRDGVTPIMMAVNKGDAEMVRVLISAGAKIDDAQNDFLKESLLAGHFDTAKILEDAGAHVENQKELTLKGKLTQFAHQTNREGAEEVFQTLEKEFPNVDRRAEIFQLGSIYFRQGLYEQSIDLHREIIKLYPNSISVLSAYYQIAQAYRKLGFDSSMVKAYEDLLSYPVTDDKPSPYDIINVKEVAKEELGFYHKTPIN